MESACELPDWRPVASAVGLAWPERVASGVAGLDLVAQGGAGAERDYFHFKPVWQRALIVVAAERTLSRRETLPAELAIMAGLAVVFFAAAVIVAQQGVTVPL